MGIDADQAPELGVFEGHTPGPWTCRDGDRWFTTDYWDYPFHLDSESTSIAIGEKGDVVAFASLADHSRYDDRGDECEANARLIAAAPQLLAEVKRQRARIAELEKFEARYRYIRDNLTWHRHGDADDPESYSLVGCKFDYAADFQASVMLDHHIDAAMEEQGVGDGDS